jgi:hypothetical protein
LYVKNVLGAEHFRVLEVLCLLQKGFLPETFSFGCKREPENNQRFQRAGSMKKGLLAPFRPQSRKAPYKKSKSLR